MVAELDGLLTDWLARQLGSRPDPLAEVVEFGLPAVSRLERLVQEDAQAPLLAPVDPFDHPVDALAPLRDVLQGARIGAEEREQLHRNDGAVPRHVLHHGFMGDGHGRDPGQIPQAPLDRLFSVPLQRSVGGHQPEAKQRQARRRKSTIERVKHGPAPP